MKIIAITRASVVALQAARRRGLALSAARAEVVKCPQILRNVPVGVLARPGEQVRAGLSPAARRFAPATAS